VASATRAPPAMRQPAAHVRNSGSGSIG
jgi:hypothetical protein